MSKQHVLDIIHTAQGRAAAIDATAPGFAFNKALSVEGYHASIDEAREEVFQYIALQSQLNAQRGRMLAAGRALAERSSRMLCAVHSTFGKDSHQYQAAAAVKSSAPRRKSRKRRGAAVATGSRAAESMPGRSTAQRPVEEIHPVAHEGLVGKGLVDVGQKGDVGTEPRRDVADETDATRRTEALPPREVQEGDASPADAVERGEEIDGAEEVAEEDLAAPGQQALAIDADDARRAGVEAFTVPEPSHADALEDGNDPEADSNRAHPHVTEGAENPCEQDGEEGATLVAILLCSSAALHIKAREHRIGGSPRPCTQRGNPRPAPVAGIKAGQAMLRIHLSAHGAAQASPGQRPGLSQPRTIQALTESADP